MHHLFRLTVAAVLALALAFGFALVQSGGASAQQGVPQIPLTEKQVQGFIATQKDMGAIESKLEEGDASSEEPDAKIQAEIEGIVKKNGFANLDEFDTVAANISMVVAGIDPKTKAYSDQRAANMIKQEIEVVRADKSIPAKEKQELVQQLNDAVKSAQQPIKHRGNIDLVKKYYDQLEIEGAE